MKTAVLILALVAFAAAQSGCPRIVTRSEWGARAPYSITYQYIPVPYVVIHHAESAPCSTQSACSSAVRGFQDYHMDSNGWSDIGYSWLVGGDGNIYEGRGWDRVGAHAPGYNDQSIGVCFIGSFTSSVPVPSAISAAKQLIQCGMDSRNVQFAHSLIGHRQAVSTDCPGDALYNEIKTWDNYNPSP